MSRRIGILGGTFNPIHNGHIKMCTIAAREFELDSVLLLMSGQPPHKTSDVLDKELRYDMVSLVCANQTAGAAELMCTRLEMDRQGYNYTVDSLRALKEIYGEDCELFFLIGSDTLLEVKTWFKSDEVFSLTNFICIPRPGIDDSDARFYMNLRLKEYKDRIFFAHERGQHVSSTNVRRRIAQGLSVCELLPDYIERYIEQRSLYRDSAFSFEEVGERIKQVLSPRRFEHTLGVVEAAEGLARRHGVELPYARWAALLHDCAKPYEGVRALALCAHYGVELDEQTLKAPALIHAPLGAAIAMGDYGMYDEDVLRAITLHATGDSDMRPLDKIIYLADAMEPGRNYPSVEKLRSLANSDLDAAMLFALEHSILYVLNSGEWLHSATVRARNTFLERMKSQ